MPANLNRARVLFAWMAVVIVGALAGTWGYFEERAERLGTIQRATENAALAMRIEEVALLTGTHADEGTEAFKFVVERLRKICGIQHEIHCVSLNRYNSERNELVCFANSEPPGSEDYARPGDAFPILLDHDDIGRTLSEDVVTFREAVRDVFGNWVVAYLRMRLRERDEWLIVRLDAPISGWRLALAEAALARGLIAWLLLGLPLAVYMLGLRHSQQTLFIDQLCAAVEQSAVAMMIMDAKGIIRHVNSGFCGLSRYTREELIGKPWLGTASDMDQVQLTRVKRASAEGKMWREDFKCERKGGEKYMASITAMPARNSAQCIIAHIILITDISELARQATELREAKERAEATGQAKSVFLATMSHEVRTPLHGIVGFSELLVDTPLDEEQREYVHAIRASSATLMRLTNHILDFSRLESGVVKLVAEPCDVRALIAGVFEMLRPQADKKGLQLLETADADVPALVCLDVVRLRQVLVNLVDNAIKFTQSGKVEVSVSLRAPDSGMTSPPLGPTVADAKSNENNRGDLRLEFAVRDTGIGIAEKEQALLFKPFVQLDSGKARHFEGVGLGLVISYDLVRLMGGSISISSEKGRGSTFSFFVCCDEVREQAISDMDERAGSNVSRSAATGAA